MTNPLNANNAIKFGITIRPLNISVKAQTKSTFKKEPTTKKPHKEEKNKT